MFSDYPLTFSGVSSWFEEAAKSFDTILPEEMRGLRLAILEKYVGRKKWPSLKFINTSLVSSRDLRVGSLLTGYIINDSIQWEQNNQVIGRSAITHSIPASFLDERAEIVGVVVQDLSRGKNGKLTVANLNVL